MDLFGYSLSLNRWPTPWQRGFWIDRVDATLTRVGLGAALLSIERTR